MSSTAELPRLTADDWLARAAAIEPRTHAFIDGRFVAAAAGIWTRDVKRAHRLAWAIRAGTVWVNTFDTADITVPFGGFKQSGCARIREQDMRECHL